MPILPRRRVPALLLSLLILAPGCGRAYSLAPVAGHVTLDGKPVAGAEVSFYPIGASKDTPYASGVTDDQGHFTLAAQDASGAANGAVVGENRVTITHDRLNSSKGKPKAKDIMKKRDDIPAKYNQDSTLTFTVPPGGTDKADFVLTSK